MAMIHERNSERGMTLIELMIAMVVLMVGIVGCMGLMSTTIGGNWRSRQQSNSTAMAQMITEKIMSVNASSTPTLTITDCNNTSNTVSTVGSSGGSGAPLLSTGDVDYSQAAVANYSMNYSACGPNTSQESVYDVRWNIQTLSPFTKLVTVSAKLRSTGNAAMFFAKEVTIRTVVGQR